jgi:hypothetical protein
MTGDDRKIASSLYQYNKIKMKKIARDLRDFYSFGVLLGK